MALKVALALLSAISIIPAQTIWSVQGRSGTNNLAAVLAQAAPGDVLVFVPNTGTFDTFTLTIGVQLIGPAIVASMGTGQATTAFSIPAGQRAIVRGVVFGPNNGLTQAVTVQGHVSFEECQFGSFDTSGNVVLRDCHVVPNANDLRSRMRVTGGVCSISGGTFTGSSGFGWPGYPYPHTPGLTAIEITSGTVIASGIVAAGGNGSCNYYGPVPGTGPAAPAIRVFAPGKLQLADSQLTGGSGICGTPNAVAIEGTVDAIVSRTTLVGGLSPGVQVSSQLLGLGIAGGFVLGQTTTATATAGSSMQLLAIVGGFDATPSTLLPVVGPVFGAGSQPIVLTTAMPTVGGRVVHAVQVPNAATLRYLPVWLQAFQLDGSRVFASPLAGGVIH